MDLIEQLEQGRYGAFEMKRYVGPNLVRGLIISLLIHTVVVAAPYIINLIRGEEDIPERVIVIDPSQLTQLQRQREDSPETIQIERPKIAPPKAAIPVAVAEDEVIKEELIPTQEDIAEFFDSGADEDLEIDPNANVVIAEDPNAIPDSKDFIAFEVPPQPLETNPQPAYPDLARTAGVTGRVVVKMFVDKKGEVKKYEIVQAKPEGLGFEEEVQKVVMKWKFTPAIQQGNPIGVWVSYPFKFTLQGK